MARKPITQAMRRAVAERLGCAPGGTLDAACAYCDAFIQVDWTDPRRVRFLDDKGRSRPELDHVIPVIQDGPHTPDNLVQACLSCNRSKGGRRP